MTHYDSIEMVGLEVVVKFLREKKHLKSLFYVLNILIKAPSNIYTYTCIFSLLYIIDDYAPI